MSSIFPEPNSEINRPGKKSRIRQPSLDWLINRSIISDFPTIGSVRYVDSDAKTIQGKDVFPFALGKKGEVVKYDRFGTLLSASKEPASMSMSTLDTSLPSQKFIRPILMKQLY